MNRPEEKMSSRRRDDLSNPSSQVLARSSVDLHHPLSDPRPTRTLFLILNSLFYLVTSCCGQTTAHYDRSIEFDGLARKDTSPLSIKNTQAASVTRRRDE